MSDAGTHLRTPVRGWRDAAGRLHKASAVHLHHAAGGGRRRGSAAVDALINEPRNAVVPIKRRRMAEATGPGVVRPARGEDRAAACRNGSPRSGTVPDAFKLAFRRRHPPRRQSAAPHANEGCGQDSVKPSLELAGQRDIAGADHVQLVRESYPVLFAVHSRGRSPVSACDGVAPTSSGHPASGLPERLLMI